LSAASLSQARPALPTPLFSEMKPAIVRALQICIGR
jgi:hypothetical protein